MSIQPTSGPSIPSISPSSTPRETDSPAVSTEATNVAVPPNQAASEVHLSSASQQLQQLQAAVQNPEFDVDTVQVLALQEAIKTGTYSINARAIADGIVASVRELMKRRVNAAPQRRNPYE